MSTDFATWGRIGALERASRPDYNPQEATRAATNGYWAKLHQEVDPDNRLDPVERDRRAKRAWAARMARARMERKRQTR